MPAVIIALLLIRLITYLEQERHIGPLLITVVKIMRSIGKFVLLIFLTILSFAIFSYVNFLQYKTFDNLIDAFLFWTNVLLGEIDTEIFDPIPEPNQ